MGSIEAQSRVVASRELTLKPLPKGGFWDSQPPGLSWLLVGGSHRVRRAAHSSLSARRGIERAHHSLASGQIEATRCTLNRQGSHDIDPVDEDRWGGKGALPVHDFDARQAQVAEAVAQKSSRVLHMQTVRQME